MTEHKQQPIPVVRDPAKVEHNRRALASGIVRPLGYLAGPITSDPHRHMQKAAFASLALTRAYPIELVVPHASVALEEIASRRPEEWLRLDGAMLARCDFVFRLPGDSNGADAEEALAGSLEIPVFHQEGELATWLHDRAIATGLAMRGQNGGLE